MIYGILSDDPGVITDADVILPFVSPISIYSNQLSRSSDTINLKRVTSQLHGAQRWEIETRLMPSNDSSTYLTHSVSKGIHSVFPVRMPQVYRNDGSASLAGSTTNGVHLAGATNIKYQGGSIKSGEFITFGDPLVNEADRKVYLVVNASTGNIEIHPPLRVDSPTNKKISVGGDTVLFCRYDEGTQLGISYVDGILSDPGTVTLVEAT